MGQKLVLPDYFFYGNSDADRGHFLFIPKTLKFGKEPAQSLEIWALSRFVYIGYTVLFGGKLKKFLVA